MAVSLCGRATTAEKCPRERDARAKLLFSLSEPIAFLPLSLPSSSSLRKLHIITRARAEREKNLKAGGT